MEQLKSAPVQIVTNAQVRTTTGADRLENIEIAVTGESEPGGFRCQKRVAALGLTANLGSLREWGSSCTTTGTQWLPRRCAQRRGHLLWRHHRQRRQVRLIAVSFGELATAVNNASVHIDPASQPFPGHSTDNRASVPVPPKRTHDLLSGPTT
jgi:ferredoxin/flavodoxin---NADP+ reductase